MTSVFNIFSSDDCDFYYNGIYQGHITGESSVPYRFVVARKGVFRVNFINNRYKSELKMDITIGTDEEKIVDLDFSEVNAPIIKAEKDKEEQRILEEKLQFEKQLAYRKTHISDIGDFSEGLARFERDGKWGFLDKNGNEIIASQYHEVGDFSEGLARVKREYNSNWGFIDSKGNEVISCIYREAGDFSEGLAYVYNSGYGYFIDKNGNELTPHKYDWSRKESYKFSDGLMKVSHNSKWGFLDASGKEVIPCKYDKVEDFSEGFARVTKNFKYNFINKNGIELLGHYYEYCSEKFTEGLAWIGYELAEDQLMRDLNRMATWDGIQYDYKFKGPDFLFIDKTGKTVLGPYKGTQNFSEGLAGVKKDGKWGFIDKSGKIIISYKFDKVGDFSEGLAAVGKGSGYHNIWGFINKSGNEIIPYKYEKKPEKFIDGFSMVSIGADHHGFIDKYGNEVIPLEYQYFSHKSFSEGFVVISKNYKWRFVDKNGREILTFK